MDTVPYIRGDLPPASDRPAAELSAQALLAELLTSSIIAPHHWDSLTAQARDEVMQCADSAVLLTTLLAKRLLTEYQAARVKEGRTYELILGNYRILDRIGCGGMGIVLKAEHIHMRGRVAVKVLPITRDDPPSFLQRFYAEMRALAGLKHPHIVSAIDAGEVATPDPARPVLHYFVMEYIPGQNLEDVVKTHGPLPVPRACDLIHQVAWALMETHKHDLIHRDIKPSNILVAPDGQAKLLDFGLVRDYEHRVTQLRAALGTPLYMAPEQALDASAVDHRADIYGLGATLFWCLTGREAFPAELNIAQALRKKLNEPPPSVRTWQPELPTELDAVVSRMMAIEPADRYPTAEAVMTSLLPFLQAETPRPACCAP